MTTPGKSPGLVRSREAAGEAESDFSAAGLVRPTEGSLCTGYNGLGLAVEEVFGTELAWYSEIEAAPAEVMAARYPGVPNLGDLTALAWEDVPQVDVMTAGYPCQPFQPSREAAGVR